MKLDIIWIFNSIHRALRNNIRKDTIVRFYKVLSVSVLTDIVVRTGIISRVNRRTESVESAFRDRCRVTSVT